MWMYIAIALGILLIISMVNNVETNTRMNKVMYTNVYLYSLVIHGVRERDGANLYGPNHIERDIDYIQRNFNKNDN
ncbi:hypothetical protein [Staphylococcus nepalensis]|uniref:hypothetical protein n=1 Tax=Staphylococcus nepalensis TaxID=214473 RepID=UPI003CF6D1B8